MDNQFSCHNIFNKAFVNGGKKEKQFIKTTLTSKALNLLSKKKKKLDYKNEEGTFTCPDCNKIVPQLHNAHVGPTQSYMIDDILKNFNNEQKDIIEYWNNYCDMHKFVKIAVCCSECNTKYEDNNLSKIKMNINYIISPEIKEDISDKSSDSDNDSDNINTKTKFKNDIEKIKEYPVDIIELFKDLSRDISYHKIGSNPNEPLKENQRKLYITDLNILFHIIGREQLHKMYELYNDKKYQDIINILEKIQKDINNHEIKKEWNNNGKIGTDPVGYARPFNKCIIKLLENYIKIGYQSSPSDSGSAVPSGSSSTPVLS